MDASERKTPVTWDPPRDEDWFWAFAKAIGTDSGLDVPLCPDGVAGSLALFKRAAQAEALVSLADKWDANTQKLGADAIAFTLPFSKDARARAAELEGGA